MDTVISRDGTRIAFDRSGEGPPVILVAGAMGDRHAGDALAPLLAHRFTVIAYDRRGRGDSGDTAPYAVEREVEDIAVLVDAAGGSAFVYGHSSGAILALEAAARSVGVTGLALYEPPFLVDDSRPPVPADYVAQLEEMVAAGRRGDAVAYFMRVAVAVPPQVIEQIRSGPVWPSLEGMAQTLAYDGRVVGDTMFGSPEPLRRYASVRTPTLTMDGGDSPSWLRTPARMVADILPNGRHRTLEGQTHGVDPARLAPVLVEFFGALTAAA